MKETLLDLIYRFLVLVSGHIPLNICKVMTAAFLAGTFLSAACLEGPYTLRACIAFMICVNTTCFFGVLTAVGTELEEEYEEDDLCV